MPTTAHRRPRSIALSRQPSLFGPGVCREQSSQPRPAVRIHNVLQPPSSLLAADVCSLALRLCLAASPNTHSESHSTWSPSDPACGEHTAHPLKTEAIASHITGRWPHFLLARLLCRLISCGAEITPSVAVKKSSKPARSNPLSLLVRAIGMTLTVFPRKVPTTDKASIPTPNLPPPYTWTGIRSRQLRYVAQGPSILWLPNANVEPIRPTLHALPPSWSGPKPYPSPYTPLF